MPADAARSMPEVTARETATPSRPPIASEGSARRKRRRVLWVGAALAVLATAGGVGLYWLSHRGPPTTYTTAQLDRGTVAHAVTASGTVNPVLTIIVGSYVSGVIQDIACDYNTPVHKGQVCARIDPRPYQMAVDQAAAALEVARAQLVKDRAVLRYAEASYGRNSRLEGQGWIAHDAAENQRSVRDAASAQLAVDEADIAQRQAALRAAQVNLGYTRIVSPVDGVVVSRNVTQGQTVAASFQTPTLFLIAQDLTKMEVDTNVSEGDIEGEGRGIRVGDPATFTVEAFPGRRFQGRVSQIRQAPQTVQNVVTYDVVIAVDNHDMRLKPGMTATARIITDQRADVLRAPNAALRYTPGGLRPAGQGGEAPAAHGERLFVMRDGKPSPISVRAGLADDNFTEIASGAVVAGDPVVIAEAGVKSGARAPLPRF